MSTTGLDLHSTVDANVNPYEQAMLRAERATRQYELSLDRANASVTKLEKQLDDDMKASLQRSHDAMDKTGKAFLIGGAAIAAGLVMATDQAIKWEYAWKGVQKTVNGNVEQMAALEGQLRDLTKVLPASHEEIAAVAEAAGQLGVARQDVAKFTETAINLGQATNLSAEDAATSIAQFLNVMGAGADQVDHVGNTLVALGNKGASTESQIMEMASRLSGAGKLIGASSSDVLGLAASMANLGIQAQLGGGAMQRTLTIIYSKMKEGGPTAERFAQIAGMSAQKFATEWSNDPVKAVDAFVQGLGRIKASGGNVVGTLKEVGISGTQNLNVLLRLAGAGDMLTKSIDQSSNAWKANTALATEVEKRYQTTEAQIELARNQLVDASIDIGNTFLPMVAQVVSTGRDLAAAWQDLPGPLKTATAVLALLAAGIALTGGAALIAVPKIAAFNVAVTELEAGALKTAGLRLQGLASTLMGPVGIALAVGAVALGSYAAKQQEAKRRVDDLAASLDQQTAAVTDNTRQKLLQEVATNGVLDDARTLGFNLGLVTNAYMGNTEAIEQVRAATDKYYTGTQARVGAAGEETSAAHNLRDAIFGSNDALTDAQKQIRLKAEADKESAGAARDNTHAVKGTTDAWNEGADAAGELAQEVKTLGDELHDASSDYLDNRDAARQVRDALREIQGALHQYVKDHKSLTGAFKDGTKSADEFSGLLDRLAEDYQNQITTTEKVTGSEKAVQRVYDQSRDKLIKVAEQLGMTKQEAENYVTQVLQVPAVVSTHFEQPGVEGATQNVQNYRSWLEGIPTEVITHLIARHDPSIGGGGDPDKPGGGSSGGAATGHHHPASGSGNGAGTRAPAHRWFHDPQTTSRASARPGMSRSVAASGGGELSVSGVLDTPWGPAEVHGIATGAAHRVYSERSADDRYYEEQHG